MLAVNLNHVGHLSSHYRPEQWYVSVFMRWHLMLLIIHISSRAVCCCALAQAIELEIKEENGFPGHITPWHRRVCTRKTSVPLDFPHNSRDFRGSLEPWLKYTYGWVSRPMVMRPTKAEFCCGIRYKPPRACSRTTDRLQNTVHR